MEIWKPVYGFTKRYLVSNKGRVKGIHRVKHHILTPRLRHRYNYTSTAVKLYKNKIGYETQIARIVAKAFIPNPYNRPFVNHKDNDATNNKASNLEWVTRKQNIMHAKKQNRFKKCGRKLKNKEFGYPQV